jgi:hypothetical protein
MPTKEVGHGHGPCHPATTPLDRRYLECPFEDIERTIHVCLHFPTTGAGIKATMLTVGSKDLTAIMASSGSVPFIDPVLYFNPCPFPFVPDHVDDLTVWPVMQTLIDGVTVVNAFPNAVEISDCNFPDPFFEAFRNQMRGCDM